MKNTTSILLCNTVGLPESAKIYLPFVMYDILMNIQSRRRMHIASLLNGDTFTLTENPEDWSIIISQPKTNVDSENIDIFVVVVGSDQYEAEKTIGSLFTESKCNYSTKTIATNSFYGRNIYFFKVTRENARKQFNQLVLKHIRADNLKPIVLDVGSTSESTDQKDIYSLKCDGVEADLKLA